MAIVHGKWLQKDSKLIYDTPWLNVFEDEVTNPLGEDTYFNYVKLRDGVVVLPLIDNNKLVLQKSFHYLPNTWVIEAVSGGCEKDESIEDAARRELLEEMGYTAGKLIKLGEFKPFIDKVIQKDVLFLAEGVSQVGAKSQSTEELVSMELSVCEAVEMVYNNQIAHAATAMAILKAAHYLRCD